MGAVFFKLNKKHIFIFYIFFTFFIYSTAYSAPDLDDHEYRIEALEETATKQLQWEGNLESSISRHQDKGPQGMQKEDAVVRTHLKPKYSPARGYNLNLDIMMRGDSGNPTRNTVRLDEAYVSAKFSQYFQVRGGKIVYNWGNAPYSSPIDVMNPVDYYELTHPDKLGIIAIDMTWMPSAALSFTSGIVPIFEPSVFINQTSRWINFSEVIDQVIMPNISVPSTYGIPLPSQLTTADVDVKFKVKSGILTFPQPFLKLDYKSILFDFTAIYTLHFNPLPADFMLTSTSSSFDITSATPSVTIEGIPFYEPEHAAGASLSFSAIGCTFFADGLMKVPLKIRSMYDADTIMASLALIGQDGKITKAEIETPRTNAQSITLATGLRKDWTKFHLYLQYMKTFYGSGSKSGSLFQKFIPETSSDLNDLDPGNLRALTAGSVAGGFFWDIGDVSTIYIGGLYNTQAPSYVASGGLHFRLTEGVKLMFQYDRIDGRNNTVFHRMRRNSKYLIGLNMIF